MDAETSTHMPFARLLLTGAAGNLGRVLRPRLKTLCDSLRLSDITSADSLLPLAPGEEVCSAALQDKAAVMALLQGVRAVVHLGGLSVESPFEDIVQANIIGTYHVYEAARVHGVKRIVFASSNHVTGFYKQGDIIDVRQPMRPDSFYGLSKAFGENLAQFYFDRHGIETVSLRIGSAVPQPLDLRMLTTWLSHDDFWRLVVAALCAPVVEHTVIYGVSNNRGVWWDNTGARHLGFVPRDSAEPFRAALEAQQPARDSEDPATRYQGGSFVTAGPF